MVRWAFYGPLSGLTFWGCVSSYQLYNDGEVTGLLGGEWWESSIFLGGSSAASLTIPYFVLNKEEKFNFPKSILTDSEKEIYKQAYSKKLKKRKFKYIVGSTIVTGAVVVFFTFRNFSLDFGGDSDWGMGGYSGP
jgi:hypothetical protein